MSSRSRRGAGGERGATLAEFALIFGLLVSTVLTLLVIPVVYYHYHWRQSAA